MALDPSTRARALALLAAAVAGAGKGGKAAVAERLGAGCSRSLLARVLSPSDPCGMSDRLAVAVIRAYDRRTCPVDGEEKTPAHCRRVALRPRPYGFPDADSLWQACQTCPHKPTQGETK